MKTRNVVRSHEKEKNTLLTGIGFNRKKFRLIGFLDREKIILSTSTRVTFFPASSFPVVVVIYIILYSLVLLNHKSEYFNLLGEDSESQMMEEKPNSLT